MRAIVADRYGDPHRVLTLRDIDPPTLPDDRVLVRVKAAAINAGDWHQVLGRPYAMRTATGLRRPRNRVPGMDLSGVVEAVGSRVTTRHPGDEVVGWGAGTFAELTVAHPDRLLPRPTRLSWEEAAALPTAGVTALLGVRDVCRLEPGQQILVIGASGGVGSFAVRVARAMGAHVTAVGSGRNQELLRAIGADAVIDYERTDWTRTDTRYDAVLQLAGTTSPRIARRVLTPRGTLALSSGEGRWSGVDRILAAAILDRLSKQTLRTFLQTEDGTHLAALTAMVESGAVTPLMDRTFSLADAADAIAYQRAGHTRGKSVIVI